MKTSSKKYKRIAAIETKKPTQTLALTGIGLAAAAIVFVIGCLFVPISELYNVSGILELLLRLLVIVILAYGCFMLHETLHAMLLKKYCGDSVQRVNIGLRMFYHTSKCGLEPKAFFTVKLLPTVAIFVLLLLICILLPESLFWEVYIILVMDIACASPYYCMAYILLRSKKKNVLILETDDAVILSSED